MKTRTTRQSAGDSLVEAKELQHVHIMKEKPRYAPLYVSFENT